MELKVWVEGIQRVVCGVSETTTCQDIIYALAHATSRTGRFALIEKWRTSERSLSPQDQPLKLLSKWGEYSQDVQFILRCLDPQRPSSVLKDPIPPPHSVLTARVPLPPVKIDRPPIPPSYQEALRSKSRSKSFDDLSRELSAQQAILTEQTRRLALLNEELRTRTTRQQEVHSEIESLSAEIHTLESRERQIRSEKDLRWKQSELLRLRTQMDLLEREKVLEQEELLVEKEKKELEEELSKVEKELEELDGSVVSAETKTGQLWV